MPRPTRYAFNDWLFYKLRLRYVLLGLVVVVAAAWAADKLGWLPEAGPAKQVQVRPGY